jgi:tRNA-splicing ligase RtcB
VYNGLAEEQSKAYKDAGEVVSVVDRAGLSKRVARMRLLPRRLKTLVAPFP